MKRSLFIFTALLLTSCSNISDNNSNDLIARAGENFLYQNQLPSFSSEQDSILRYLNYIETWAKEKILYDLSLTNLSQSKGRIVDADYATETANLARTQVLQQASMAMLAQANASKQNILTLFQ